MELNIKQALVERVMDIMSWDREKTLMWFRSENPHLGGVSPDFMLVTGREEKLKNFIETAALENKR